jgi:hypothetical protein
MPGKRFVRSLRGLPPSMPPHWLPPVNRIASNRAPGAVNGAKANQALPKMFGDRQQCDGTRQSTSTKQSMMLQRDIFCKSNRPAPKVKKTSDPPKSPEAQARNGGANTPAKNFCSAAALPPLCPKPSGPPNGSSA